jgi:hypothetical protein
MVRSALVRGGVAFDDVRVCNCGRAIYPFIVLAVCCRAAIGVEPRRRGNSSHTTYLSDGCCQSGGWEDGWRVLRRWLRMKTACAGDSKCMCACCCCRRGLEFRARRRESYFVCWHTHRRAQSQSASRCPRAPIISPGTADVRTAWLHRRYASVRYRMSRLHSAEVMHAHVGR